MMADLEGIASAVIEGKREIVTAKSSTRPIEEKVHPGDILNKGPDRGDVGDGRSFRSNEFYVPEVLIAARAMHAGMAILQPLLSRGRRQAARRSPCSAPSRATCTTSARTWWP